MNDAQTPRIGPQAASIPEEIASAPAMSGPVPEPSRGEVVPPDHPALKAEHGEFAAFHQGYVWNAISLADTKAAWSFAVCAGMIAYLLAQAPTASLFLNSPWVLASYLCAGALIGLSVGAVFAFLVIVPRLGGSPEGLVYFGAVALRKNAVSYVSDVGRAAPDALTRARLTHSYDISLIADRKYRHLRTSMWAALAGLVCAAIVIAMGWTTGEAMLPSEGQDGETVTESQTNPTPQPVGTFRP